ncbi:MAG: Nif3-like dinuclear metal center hexameric protein [Bacteroidales bacterium]|nr:Nif3-like dinuclear metal center hexameric protein [Bacteroidales bacterium]
MKIKEIITYIDQFAPLDYQEEYDNSGLLVSHENDITGVLLSIDVTEEVIVEAVKLNANLIVSHHPVIFSGIKKLTGDNYVERTIIKAIKNDIAIYSAHTNIDNIYKGVNSKICKKLGLINTKILLPKKNLLCKLVTFVPFDHANKVREALFKAGAGKIDDYDSCSYNIKGEGTFRGGDNTNPYVGKKGKLHFENEVRIETIIEKRNQYKIINELLKSHPYEEVAYDIYPLENEFLKVGTGMIGETEKPIKEIDFLNKIKEAFNLSVIKHTQFIGKTIHKVAVCGGSGSFLIKPAIYSGADILISSDFKYHQFFDAENKIIIVDIGHFESEQFTIEIFYELFSKKFSNFAIHLSKVNTNPIKYL